MAKRKSKKKVSWKSLFLTILFIIILLAGYYVYTNYIKDKEPDDDGGAPVVTTGAISFHFMTLGNEYAGDCTYIKAGDNDILIDAGSRANSIDDIKNYIDNYVTDGKLEYVIVTHGDQDHIAGFAKKDGSIFDLYECETIIGFP